MPEINLRCKIKTESVAEVPKVRISILSLLSFRPGYLLGAIRNIGQIKELFNNSQHDKTEMETMSESTGLLKGKGSISYT